MSCLLAVVGQLQDELFKGLWDYQLLIAIGESVQNSFVITCEREFFPPVTAKDRILAERILALFQIQLLFNDWSDQRFSIRLGNEEQ